VNARLDQDKTELGVLVFTVDFKVLAHGHRLFDEVPKVLWDGWCQSYPQTKGMCKQDAVAEMHGNEANGSSVHQCFAK
jgi:hypothetical protein